MSNLSFVSLLAYDYKYAFKSIRTYYDIADEIILGLDQDHISWSGNKYEFSEEDLGKFLEEFDTEKKIKVVRGNYHKTIIPLRNDTDERNHLSTQCKDDNWVIQIDADEMALNPKEFSEWMAKTPEMLAVKGKWITILKSFGDKYVVIDEGRETDGSIYIGTKMKNSYTVVRDTPQPAIESPLRLLHMSWGRTREELKMKLENWGHSKDFDINKFLEMWDSITLDNYMNYTNIHPLHGPYWPKLKVVDASEIK
jgi:hypothetical protein